MKTFTQTLMPALLVLFALSLVGCNKLPESEEAKKVGAIPKQTLDKAVTGLNNANDQAAERLKDAEKQK